LQLGGRLCAFEAGIPASSTQTAYFPLETQESTLLFVDAAAADDDG